MVVVVFGLPGSGKSYFTEALASRLGMGYLSTDVVRREIFANPEYSKESKGIVYKELLKRAIDLLQTNKSVVVDGTFYKKTLRDRFVLMAKEYNVPIYFIEVIVNEQLAKKRLDKPRVISDANYEVYMNLKEEYESMLEVHLSLDSENDVNSMIDTTIEYLDMKCHDKQGNTYFN